MGVRINLQCICVDGEEGPVKATIRVLATEIVYEFRVDAAAAVAALMVVQPRLDDGISVPFEALPSSVAGSPPDSEQMAVHIRITPSTEFVVEDLDPEDDDVRQHISNFEAMLSRNQPISFGRDGLSVPLPEELQDKTANNPT